MLFVREPRHVRHARRARADSGSSPEPTVDDRRRDHSFKLSGKDPARQAAITRHPAARLRVDHIDYRGREVMTKS
jgi:hypothetical protein